MKYSPALVVAAIAASACTSTTPARSSTSVLSPERTWVIVGEAAEPATADLIQRFGQRGFPLADQKRDATGVLLRFAGTRKQVTEETVDPITVAAAVVAGATSGSGSDSDDDTEAQDPPEPSHVEQYQVGSAFYVRVESRGDAATWISAVGRPTRDGVEACTADQIDAPCTKLEGHDEDVAGTAEAEVIDGVFGELRRAGLVTSADPAIAESARRCQERRREYETRAAHVSDPRAKAGILRAAPHC